MMNRIRMILNREEGASAVEYALLVAGIAAVIIAAVFLIGNETQDTFTTVANSL